MSEITHFINGQIVNGNSSRRQDVFNPATGNADKTVTLAGENDVDDAVRAAKEAWPEWSKTPVLRRHVFWINSKTFFGETVLTCRSYFIRARKNYR